jgi:hypothetical protein
MSEDPIKDGFNWQIYVNNGPTMFTDPSGLESRRHPLLDPVIAELQRLIDAGVISKEEANLRYHILKLAVRGKLGFEGRPYSPWRDPSYWTKNDDDYYIVRPGKLPSDAIDDIWTDNGGRKYRTGCKKATELIILGGILDLAQNLDRENNNTLAVDEFNRRIRGLGRNPPTDIVPGREYTDILTSRIGFDISDLRPGDQVWFENPRFSGGHGLEGSNIFYLGGEDLFRTMGRSTRMTKNAGK